MCSLSTEPDGSGHTSFHALLPTKDESPKPFSSTCGSTCDSPSDSKKVSSARRAQHGALTAAPPRLQVLTTAPNFPLPNPHRERRPRRAIPLNLTARPPWG
jgi:hypothetical protein